MIDSVQKWTLNPAIVHVATPPSVSATKPSILPLLPENYDVHCRPHSLNECILPVFLLFGVRVYRKRQKPFFPVCLTNADYNKRHSA